MIFDWVQIRTLFKLNKIDMKRVNSHLKFIDNPPDWNELGLNSKGIIISAIGYYQGENIIGFPDGAYKYGCLLTINTYNANSPERPYRNAQIYIPHNGSTVGNILPIYVRTFGDIKDTSGSRVWRKIVASELVDAYAR